MMKAVLFLRSLAVPVVALTVAGCTLAQERDVSPTFTQKLSDAEFFCHIGGIPVECDWFELCLIDGGDPVLIDGYPYCCHENICEGYPQPEGIPTPRTVRPPELRELAPPNS